VVQLCDRYDAAAAADDDDGDDDDDEYSHETFSY